MKKIITLSALVMLAACVRTPQNIDGDQVYFAFDSAVVTDSARENLTGQAEYLKKNPDVSVVVGGHCDERGSVEYNLALGALRAGNASHVLISEGIEPERIKAISYGKENPQYPGTGEEVWAKNRNATTTVVK